METVTQLLASDGPQSVIVHGQDQSGDRRAISVILLAFDGERRKQLTCLLQNHGLSVLNYAPSAGTTDTVVLLIDIGTGWSSDPAIAERIAELRSVHGASTAIAALTETDDSAQALVALQHGLAGLIPTNLPAALLVAAIRLIGAGGLFLSPEIVKGFAGPLKPPAETANGGPLTNREAAVRDALLKGKPNKVIARELTISESTVKIHVRNIMKKMNLSNRTQIAIAAVNALPPRVSYAGH